MSQILNGRAHLFADTTVERVLAAAAELHYRPSVAGRALVTGRSDIVVVAVPYTTFGQNLQDVIDSLTDQLATVGLVVVVGFARHDSGPMLRLVDRLRPAAVVDMGTSGPDLWSSVEEGRVPVVRIAGDIGGVGRLQVVHLVERGATQVDYAFLADGRDDVFGPARYAAVVAECARRGLPEPRTMLVPLSVAGAVEVLAAHLAGGPGAAVACYNDEVGAVLVAAARRLGLAVPGDLAVIGVDDAFVARVCEPPLTTVAIDLLGISRGIARQTCACLGLPLGAAEPGADAGRQVPIGAHLSLVPRRST